MHVSARLTGRMNLSREMDWTQVFPCPVTTQVSVRRQRALRTLTMQLITVRRQERAGTHVSDEHPTSEITVLLAQLHHASGLSCLVWMKIETKYSHSLLKLRLRKMCKIQGLFLQHYSHLIYRHFRGICFFFVSLCHKLLKNPTAQTYSATVIW